MSAIARWVGLDMLLNNFPQSQQQLCSVVDLDGPIFLKTDRANRVQYSDGMITSPERLWGGAI